MDVFRLELNHQVEIGSRPQMTMEHNSYSTNDQIPHISRIQRCQDLGNSCFHNQDASTNDILSWHWRHLAIYTFPISPNR